MTFDAVLAEVEARIVDAEKGLYGVDYERMGDRDDHAAAMARLAALKSLREWMLGELDRSLCEQAKPVEGIEG